MLRLSLVVAAALLTQLFAFAQKAPTGFEAPRRVLAQDGPVATEAPGYAAPCHADIDGDGHADLLVGQFAEGRIKVHAGRADGTFGEGKWLEVNGKAVSVPGVW